jgi:hypothetical protein
MFSKTTWPALFCFLFGIIEKFTGLAFSKNPTIRWDSSWINIPGSSNKWFIIILKLNKFISPKIIFLVS